METIIAYLVYNEDAPAPPIYFGRDLGEATFELASMQREEPGEPYRLVELTKIGVDSRGRPRIRSRAITVEHGDIDGEVIAGQPAIEQPAGDGPIRREDVMQTQRHEIDAFLGGDEFYTPEQREQIADEYLAWEREQDDYLDEETARAVLSAIAQRVDGVLDIDALAAADGAAHAGAAQARLELKAATIALVRARALSESEAERRAGVARMTVRSWLGK